MTITIELIERCEGISRDGWTVTHDGRFADGLTFEEMLGLVAALTMPRGARPSLAWMRSPEEWRSEARRQGERSVMRGMEVANATD